MNDPGLGEVIQTSGERVDNALQYELEPEREPNRKRQNQRSTTRKDDLEEDSSLNQPTLWWFSSTAFPLFAGTFGPISNLFSVCALVQTWRVSIFDGSRVPDPEWLYALNVSSLVFALIANLMLLFNFARRIPYNIAQPLTIIFWYLASLFLLIPICLSHNENIDPKPFRVAYSQSYYYALISCILYFCVSTLLLVSTLGAVVFHAYKPSFSTLTGPQRTLMLQTISFTLYLALGAGIYSKIEGWSFTDSVYWADYTLLTVGLGSDFPPVTTLGKMLLIPYAAFGITLLGLVVGSVRGLVLERAKTKVARRHLSKEREQWKENIKKRRHLAHMTVVSQDEENLTRLQRWRKQWTHRRLMRLPQQFAKVIPDSVEKEDGHGPWHRTEFELMRYIQENTESAERYAALTVSFLVIIAVWVGGSLIFWSCELHIQSMTYVDSLYFTYTTLLTIGYGDFYPKSFAGKPFFVVWSLISVPAMTVLISNMGDTVVKWVQDVTVWASKWTILPERDSSTKAGSKEKQTHNIAVSFLHHKKQSRHPSQSQKASRMSLEKSKSDESGNVHTARFEHDIEILGEHVEGFEKDEGREGSLAAQLAREIAHLAKDMRSNPPKKYTWEQWERWLEMLGKRQRPESNDHEPASPSEQHTIQPPPHEVLVTGSLENTKSQSDGTASSTVETTSEKTMVPTNSPTDGNRDQPSTSETGEARLAEHDWHWTWLDDHGPLFSELTETEWIIEKLCFRMEEVLEDEIREAREGAKNSRKREVSALQHALALETY